MDLQNGAHAGSKGRVATRRCRGSDVPAIWRLEVANALRNAVRRRRCDNAMRTSIARFARLPIVTDAETDKHAWNETLRLSRRYELTPYDSSYLELAIRLGHPIASCDAALIALQGIP